MHGKVASQDLQQLFQRPLIGRLVVHGDCGLRVCVTDRSDYYHQVAVSYERSRTNLVWPPMKLKDFLHFKAYNTRSFVTGARASTGRDRTVHGDDLAGHRPINFSTDPETEVFGCFGAILQGDHLGVEFGISAHVGLLQSVGLLPERGRLVADSITRPSDVFQGLCIDDFFCLAEVPTEQLKESVRAPPSGAFKAFETAKRCYAEEGLQGSDAKDVVDQFRATVVGAEVDSRYELVSSGMLPVGAPTSKRLALSWTAATAARLPATTDALHSSLLGALVSVFCFRRCSMSILGELFKVIPAKELNTDLPVLRPLSRKGADEMILAAVLLPIIASDVKAPFHEFLYVSDASNEKGAFCVTKIPSEIAHPLWLSADFKGSHTFLDPWQKRVLFEAENWDEEDWQELQVSAESQQNEPHASSPSRPLAQRYDFIEICGGSGVVSDQMSELGYVVGPIIDLTYSVHYHHGRYEGA